MEWRKQYLDVVLVPIGLLIMLGYHLSLLYRYLHSPHTTAAGYESHNKIAWVERMMQVELKDRDIALTVVESHITGATFMASTSLALSSVIGALMGTSSNDSFSSSITYGDTRPSMISVKCISLLSCFLVALISFIQSARHYMNLSLLMTVPDSNIPVKVVERAVIRGDSFWGVGLRALYFGTTLLFWIFGPIPMFLSALAMVVTLNFLDTNSIPLHHYNYRSVVVRASEHPEGSHGT